MVYFLSMLLFAIIALTLAAYGMLALLKVGGLRSARGILVFLLLVLSWGVGILLAYVYLPLAVIVPPILQISVLHGIARVPIIKSLVIAVLYSLTVIITLFGLFMLSMGLGRVDEF